MKTKWMIIDWANNEIFKGKLFDSFEDAEDFLSEFLGDSYEENRGEYYIIRKEEFKKN